MKNTLFAEVNGHPIHGTEILCSVKRIQTEQSEQNHYAETPNSENTAYINAEGLQQYIERIALRDVALAEGFIIDDDVIHTAIYELRSRCQDEAEWESLLSDMGLEDRELRKELEIDLYVDALFSSRLEVIDDPSNEDARTYYGVNKESMRIPEQYTFIELEVVQNAQEAAAVLSQGDGAKILAEAQKRGIKCSLTENMDASKLPENLQNILTELEIGKIASLPTDDGSLILLKLLKKTESRLMEEEEVLPGLKEYLKIMRHKALADVLIEEALEKTEVIYHNTDLLKKLK